ncbi:DUF998 domain-containing protein [Luteimonas mephitis]|uniref:DUF998 domain-containing protein n=1 Tax=Luteimonas mephitis TaxID=83615 RepID=UPI00047E84EC|nr:DUF998 domain-containing protein [Luteimonas mephitis]
MKQLPLVAAIAAMVLFVAAVAGFGAALEGYSQARHPVGLLGASGVPHALAFNVLGFVLPGLLAAFVAWRLRVSMGDNAPWVARIGAWMALLSAIAFVAQGLLPLDPGDLESDASRAHATAWTLWWVALLPATLLLALGLRGESESRARVLASIVVAVVVVALAMLPLDLLAPAFAQRVVFATWLAWTVVAAGGNRKTGMP